MKMLTAFDNWALARTKKLLDFLFDWFGITQKLVERALIVIFALSNFVRISSIILKAPDVFPNDHLPVTWEVVTVTVFGLVLWTWHRKPSSTRAATEHTWYAVLLRCFLSLVSILGFVMLLIILPLETPYTLSVQVQGWSLCLFLYVVATNVDGERKSAKLAWSKIKELFGTAWIPQPKGTTS